MNERIRELVLQANPASKEIYESDNWEYNCAAWCAKDLAKFAELIVRECMKVAVNKDSGYIHPANIAGYMAAGRSTAAQMVKEHFGVEE